MQAALFSPFFVQLIRFTFFSEDDTFCWVFVVVAVVVVDFLSAVRVNSFEPPDVDWDSANKFVDTNGNQVYYIFTFNKLHGAL